MERNQVNDKPLNPGAIAYSVAETAKLIGVSDFKIRTMLRLGELQCVRLGGRTLIRRADIDALLESNVVRAAE